MDLGIRNRRAIVTRGGGQMARSDRVGKGASSTATRCELRNPFRMAEATH